MRFILNMKIDMLDKRSTGKTKPEAAIDTLADPDILARIKRHYEED